MSTTQKTTLSINGNRDVPPDSEENGISSRFQLDIKRLHALPSEQQDLYLFTFVSDLERYAKKLDHDEICSVQASLVRELFQVINLVSPAPTRVIRNNLGRCFAHVLGKGNRKPLYDTINHLLTIINAGKSEKELQNRHAAVYCLGEVYKSVGDSAITLSSVSCSSLIRLLKAAQNHAGLRAAIVKSLGNVVTVVRGALDETLARDIWKQARSLASSDKAGLVQAKACGTLEELVRGTDYFDTTSDFETLKTVLWKAFDSPVPAARHAAAACLAAVLVKSHSEHASAKSVVKVKKPKKTLKNQPAGLEDGEEEGSRPSSPSAKRSPILLEFTLPGLLRQLSTHYVRITTSSKARAAIARCYLIILRKLDGGLVERSYGQILDHLLTDLLSSPSVSNDRHRLLVTRKMVKRILANCIGSKILGETGRLNAAKTLINDVLKNFPQVIQERPEPSKHALVGALDALASLTESLGAAFAAVADSCRDALLQVIEHPSYTVQIHVSHCLRAFVLACPQQLLACASICMNNANRELGQLTEGRHSARRCVGYANGLAAVLSISSLRPLYSSLEISAKVLSIATDLLKSSGQAELRVAGTQVQVAWIFIGGLMALGPNFVKIHLSQLLLLWRNALPRPLTKENAGQRPTAEISYLTHVRECTLGSILSFLEFNGRLVTTDVSKRIAIMLHNTMEFLDSVPERKGSDDPSTKSSFSMQTQDLILMVRRRVLQCYTKLLNSSPLASGDVLTQSNLLNLAVAMFADPENYKAGSLGSSIATSAASFDSIWDIADNSGYGVSGLVNRWSIKPLPGEQARVRRHWLALDSIEDFDEEFLTPICGAREHDSISLHLQGRQNSDELPDPPATEVVNAAIALFASALPLQSYKVQEAVLEQLATCVLSPILQRDPGRKAAVTVNTAMALLGALKVAVGETAAEQGDLRHPAVESCLQDILRMLLIDHDPYVRNLAYEALGKLCTSSGNTFTTNEVNDLIDIIVTNRDPSARAGCAMALGSIHTSVGGMAAGLHLKNIHGILLSLCSDPNPVVHFCAIEALSDVAESAGLAFSGYVASTLGLLAQLWTCDSHNEESAFIGTSNSELELPTKVVIAHSIDSLVNVLGPDIQDLKKARDLMFRLLEEFDVDTTQRVQSESLRCWEHVNLYDSKHMNLARYIHQLQENIDSSNAQIKEIAIEGLYSLMRRDAEQVLQLAGDALEDQIWLALNENPEHECLRNIIQAWLGQSSLIEASAWISRCQRVLTRTTARAVDIPPTPANKTAAPDLQDEEVAGFAASESKEQDPSSGEGATQELLCWQTRSFAMECLHDLVTVIGKDKELNPDSAAGHALQQRISDVVRIAFLASTSSVIELRVRGLRLIDQILVIFGTTPDPDFSEALLLEQYQAQISSALTPAFGADSSPELASAAVNVCATFIATGLVTDVERMGRILKFLVAALESFTTNETHDAAVGDLKVQSSNAQTMLRMAVLSAWAELQIASIEKEYLVRVVEPYVARLTPLWVASLQEFARLRFEPDISNNAGPARTDESLDTVYSAMNRQTLLKFYQDSWIRLVDAIASLIDQDSGFVFDALDGKVSASHVNGLKSPGANINYRAEPVAFFFVLFGIAIEALVTRGGSDLVRPEAQTLSILSALKKILRPSVSGNAIFRDVVFSETIELFDRLALTEGLGVQTVVVDIARNLCLMHPTANDEEEAAAGDHLSEDIEQLFELTRIIVLVLASLLPNLAERSPSSRPLLADDAVFLIQGSLEALVDASGIFPSIIKTDLHACTLHIFATILGTGACQALVVPQALPIFKRFVQTLVPSKPASSVTKQLLGCLRRFLSILDHAQRRESEASLPCAKNTLLASTILLTTSSRALPPTDPLIIRGLESMLECLQDVGLAKVAANCLRSILLTAPKSSTDEAIVRYLLPRLVTFVSDKSESDPENVRSLVAHTLVSFATTLRRDSSHMVAVSSIVIPMLLTRASADGKPIYQETAARLLELAGADQVAFRSVVAKMNPGQKTFMESVIREGGIAGRKDVGQEEKEESGEPSIALKFNFGSK